MTAARRHLRHANGPTGPGARRAAFSLAELILALGVLAIGMAMAAALFPAAIKLNEQSTRDSVGTIITQNGLAIARVHLTQGDLPDPNSDPNLACLADADHEFIPLDQQRYPNDANAGPTKRGFVVLGRRLAYTCQLVIVSYDKFSPSNTVTAKPVTIDNVQPDAIGGATAVQLSDRKYEQCVGSPLIFARQSGPDPSDAAICYPRIAKYDEDYGAILDRPMDQAPEGTAFVIVEDDGNVKKSPVMTVLVAETTLHD